ncbi:glutathione peroxidase gpx1 [Lobosporangium transversale]|nr:glutathione peroxidase gpx1 [Lobosporangium transversale]
MSIHMLRARTIATAVRATANIPISHNLRRGTLNWKGSSLNFSTTGTGNGTMFAASAAVGLASTSASPGAGDAGSASNFFSLKAKDKGHQEVDLSQYANKVILVVNVASRCGFTEQYTELEQLYKDYKDRGFVVIGFPCNQFGAQEPGSNEEIEKFCKLNYGVTFPIMDKIEVNGNNEDPVYAFLKSQKSGLMGLTRIKWNFEKFLVNKDGTVYKRYSSATKPSSIAEDIEKLL